MAQANIVVFSGGMDSYTVLQRVRLSAFEDYNKKWQVAPDSSPFTPGLPLMTDNNIFTISFDYGQRHYKELKYAGHVSAEINIPHVVVPLAEAAKRIMRGSALTPGNVAVPSGHYQAETMRKTVVPGRNTIMLSSAMAFAESLMLQMPDCYESAAVYYGAHSGDHHIYPDCRPEYVDGMKYVFYCATDGLVSLHVPYLNGNKTTILKDGYNMGLDYGKTWTCYQGDRYPCQVCGACQERAEAFAAIGMPDPLLIDVPLPDKTFISS